MRAGVVTVFDLRKLGESLASFEFKDSYEIDSGIANRWYTHQLRINVALTVVAPHIIPFSQLFLVDDTVGSFLKLRSLSYCRAYRAEAPINIF